MSNEILIVAVDEDIVDLAERFLNHRLEQVQHWREALAVRNIEVLRRLGHDLKGTAGAFGFQAVSDLASELEKALVRGDLVDAEDTLERLIDYLDRTAVVPG